MGKTIETVKILGVEMRKSLVIGMSKRAFKLHYSKTFKDVNKAFEELKKLK